MKTANKMWARVFGALMSVALVTGCSVNDVPNTGSDAGADAWNDASFDAIAVDTSMDAPPGTDAGDAGPVDAGSGFASISGFTSVCALMHDGRVACWGPNDQYGVLGVVTDAGALYAPEYVPGITNAQQLNMGSGGPCITGSDGTVRCWGNIDNEAWLPSHIVVESDGGAVNNAMKVSVGQVYGGMANVLLTTGHALGFGDNVNGTLSNGGTSSSDIPTEMLFGFGTPITNIVDISTAEVGTSCVVLSDGTVHCAGAVIRGDGIGTQGAIAFADQALYAASTPLNGVGTIACGYEHCCALQKDGSAINCFGDNNAGERGTTNAQYLTWVDSPVMGLTGKPLSIAAGYETSCAVIDNGTIQCWGLDTWGQLGDGVASSGQYSAVTVKGLPSVTPASVMSGYNFSCAVLMDGAAYCWGDGTDGLLGDGQGKASLTPVQVLMPK